MSETVEGLVVSVIEYQRYGVGHWKTIGIVCGPDRNAAERKQLMELCLRMYRLPEVAEGLRAQLGAFIEGKDAVRFDYAPESPNTTTDGLGGTLYITRCQVMR